MIGSKKMYSPTTPWASAARAGRKTAKNITSLQSRITTKRPLPRCRQKLDDGTTNQRAAMRERSREAAAPNFLDVERVRSGERLGRGRFGCVAGAVDDRRVKCLRWAAIFDHDRE